MKNKAAIYKITSILFPDRCYVGSAHSLSKRIYMHMRQLKKGTHGNPKLQNHYNKYGEGDLEFTILEEIKDRTKLLEREQYFIDSIKPYFNINPIAGSRQGMKNSNSHNEKISKAQKFSMLGNKNGIGNKGNKGRKLSEEHRRKIKENHWRKNENKILLEPNKGENNSFKSS